MSSEASSPTSLLTEQSTINGAALLASSLPLAASTTASTAAITSSAEANLGLEDLPPLKENFLTHGAPIAIDDLDDETESSLLMPSSGAAIPGSMSPVGMPFGYQSAMLSRSPYGRPLGGGHMMSTPFAQHGFITQPQPAQAPDASDQTIAQTSQAAPQTGPATPAASGKSPPIQPAAIDPTVNEPPLEIVSMATQPQAVPLSQEIQIPQPSQNVSQPNSSGGSFTAQQDEMEVLAERAFAISPRLGAIEPHVAPQAAQNRSFADTLEELLDAGLINQVLAPSDEPEGVIGDIQSPGDFEDTTEIFDESLEEEVADNNWTKNATANSSDTISSETPANEPEDVVNSTVNQEESQASSAPQAVPPTPERKDSIHETAETGTPTPPPRRKKSYKNE
ncbi:MAG: hypothetical protein IAF58_12910 [Leptolyngbya sp.]|nr:hypothetical protein [Candidatus Melainabacteria bacterium]